MVRLISDFKLEAAKTHVVLQVWGDQNDSEIVAFFLEEKIMSHLRAVLSQPTPTSEKRNSLPYAHPPVACRCSSTAGVGTSSKVLSSPPCRS